MAVPAGVNVESDHTSRSALFRHDLRGITPCNRPFQRHVTILKTDRVILFHKMDCD